MTAILSNVGYTIDRWLCKHSDQIISLFNVVGIIFWVLMIVDCIMFGGFLVTEIYRNPDVVRWVMCGAWIIACIAVACLSVYYVRKCTKAIKKHGWRTSW